MHTETYYACAVCQKKNLVHEDDGTLRCLTCHPLKPFPKTEQKVLTVTIDEEGDLIYLKTSEHDIFAEMGEVVTKRASHVEPATFWLRVAFHILRTVVSDKSRIAEWTRGWNVSWRIDTHPVGGPLLRWKHLLPEGSESIATFSNRQAAIDAEIAFLNSWFLERGTQVG